MFDITLKLLLKLSKNINSISYKMINRLYYLINQSIKYKNLHCQKSCILIFTLDFMQVYTVFRRYGKYVRII